MSFPIAVLISGRGSNLKSLIQAQTRGAYQIVGVLSNNPDAEGLEYARGADIPTAAIDHRKYRERPRFDAKLAKQLEQWQPQLIVLAGFMRVLTEDFVTQFAGRMINIHPSLLPQFPGLNTHERALQSAVQHHGASVHYVTAQLDGGPVVAQSRLEVLPEDTPESLAQRLLPLEHQLLSQVVCWIAAGRVSTQHGKVCFDDEPILDPLLV